MSYTVKLRRGEEGFHKRVHPVTASNDAEAVKKVDRRLRADPPPGAFPGWQVELYEGDRLVKAFSLVDYLETNL